MKLLPIKIRRIVPSREPVNDPIIIIGYCSLENYGGDNLWFRCSSDSNPQLQQSEGDWLQADHRWCDNRLHGVSRLEKQAQPTVGGNRRQD